MKKIHVIIFLVLALFLIVGCRAGSGGGRFQDRDVSDDAGGETSPGDSSATVDDIDKDIDDIEDTSNENEDIDDIDGDVDSLDDEINNLDI